MAVHVPLSEKAVEEAKTLMLPTYNLLKPSDGSPAATPSSKEIALGAYYLTAEDTRLSAFPTIFADKEEAIFAYQAGNVQIRQKIQVRLGKTIIDTTVGRLLFNEVLPENFDFINEAITSSVIKSLFVKAYATVSKERVVQLVDDVKDLGFFGGTLSGISFGIFDAKVYPGKAKVLEEADARVSEIEDNFNQGLITAEEKRRLTQEVWIEVSEDLADKTWNEMEVTNPIRVVIDAKVGRASRDQVKQLAAIRGLVVDPLGKIVELPIKSNFREGLSVFEYVTSSRGSRKGLTDTAIKTADAGYLTRRLVDVAHDVIIRLDDCGTKEGYEIKKETRPQVFAQRIMGRFAAKDVISPKGKKVLVVAGELIDEAMAKKIDEEGVISVIIRSPLSCRARYGMCVKCYGWDLGTKALVEVGMPVGVVAAQSIGEPGTQLTLRTKHAAGVIGVDVTQGLPRVEELVEARLPKVVSALSEITGKANIVETDEGWKVTVTSKGTPKEEREYIIPKTLELAVEDGKTVEAGESLAKGALDVKDILSIKGLRAAQEYMVNEIQKVYESQGIPINDRHVEVIVRKMSDEVRIVTTGDTPFLPGELASRVSFEEENDKVLAAGGEPASAQQVVLGITRRALYTDSWLSAASFEQTTDVLTEASLLGREDRLVGLKENVIIGRLIPVSPERAAMPQGL
jgi:DNA-directed RNA polymerase subunit beta'